MKNAGILFSRVRIGSGIVLFLYAATHLLNHALGLVSLEVLEYARRLFVGFWRSAPLNWVVVSALGLHAILAIAKTANRKSFRGLSGKEWAQIVLGFLAPVYLVVHLLFTRVIHEVTGVDDTYSFYLLGGGVPSIVSGSVFSVLLWTHGVIGIDAALMTKRWYLPWRERLKAAALLLPVLAIAGTVSAFHQVSVRAQWDPAFRPATLPNVLPNGQTFAEADAWLRALADQLGLVYLVTLIVLFTVRAAALWLRRRRHAVSVVYPDGSEVNIAPGTSVLEASLMGRIPHAHLCGGRGRCSTCRVRIYEGIEALAPPDAQEHRVLRQIGAAENVRLACQTFPQADCRVMPLLPSETSLRNFADQRFLQGSDRKIAILFADLRGFTSFAENRLPFDVVFVLNQYFQAVGRSVEVRGGYLDKFIGDGAMALFGTDTNIKIACRQAIEAAWEMGRELARLNARLAAELAQPLKIGIGLHCGDAIVAKMGYKHTSHLTAIGDAVNTASRLESLTKEFGAQLLVSEEVAGYAGIDLSAFESTEVSIRGKRTSLRAFIVPSVDSLPVSETPVNEKPLRLVRA